MQTAILFLATTLFVVAAYSDIKALRIPNVLTAAVAALGILRLVVIGDPTAALYTIGTGVLIFLVAILPFSRGLVGGGDVKLLTATAMLIGYGDLFPFLLLMSLFGALVSLVVVLIHHFLPLCLGPRLVMLLPTARLAVPYGVAIAAAGTATLLSQSSLFW